MENVNWMREKNSCRDAQQEEIGEGSNLREEDVLKREHFHNTTDDIFFSF
ncbi:hypothetical protein QG37_00935 [Candidozyma auris]|uniref:Uncharacterized protein n=1 Tax=Candidozyma auris TaxID=498019 RepID=A0A0L0P7J9_CANAR|nr:hypothetical protein QG37_00935 [[Candida] auris]